MTAPMVMLTGSVTEPSSDEALAPPVNITPASKYHREIAARVRRIQTPTTPSIAMSRFGSSQMRV